MSSKPLSQYSPRAKAAVAVLAAMQILLQALAVRDLRRRPAALVVGPKPLWYAASFVNFVGPIAYFLKGRRSS